LAGKWWLNSKEKKSFTHVKDEQAFAQGRRDNKRKRAEKIKYRATATQNSQGLSHLHILLVSFEKR
jgi:hypothetical protein